MYAHRPSGRELKARDRRRAILLVVTALVVGAVPAASPSTSSASPGDPGEPLYTPTRIDTTSGPYRMEPDHLTAVGDKLFFTAAVSDYGGEYELFVVDGAIVRQLTFTEPNPGPSALVALGDELLFTYGGGQELWTSDGTVANTGPIVDGLGEPVYWRSGDAYKVGQRVFVLDDVGRLLVTDGTAGGTSLVKDDFSLFPTRKDDPSDPEEEPRLNRYAIEFMGELFFSAWSDTGIGLWRSDGTYDGTSLVESYPSSATPHDFAVVDLPGGPTLFFAADDGSAGEELFMYRGDIGVVAVADINPGPDGSFPAEMTAFEGSVIFAANDGSSGRELWRSDGTAAGTVQVMDIYPGPDDSWPKGFRSFDGSIYFTAIADANSGFEFWRTNGASADSEIVKSINPCCGSEPMWLTGTNAGLFFKASHEALGDELWVSDGTSAGTLYAAGTRVGEWEDYDGDPYQLTVAGDYLFFAAWGDSLDQSGDPQNDPYLWRIHLVDAGSLLKQTSASLASGQTLTTDAEAGGATAADPVQVSVTPTAAGLAEIEIRQSDVPPPMGYSIVGYDVYITAPPGTQQAPIIISLVVDSSLIPPGEDASTLLLARNGVVVPDCAASDGSADPDPCVSEREPLPDGDVQLTALTSAASLWQVVLSATPDPTPTAPTPTPTPTLPPSNSGSATGGGRVLDAANQAVTLALTARSKDGRISASCNVRDETVSIRCLSASWYYQAGGSASFMGTAELDGVLTTYRIDLTDGGQGGAAIDTFCIVTGSGYSLSGALAQGNIQVHP